MVARIADTRAGAAWTAAALIVLVGTGCAGARPAGPDEPQIGEDVRAAAFVIDVDLMSRDATVIGAPARVPALPHDVSASILGHDVLDAEASNYVNSPIGAFAPGKVRVTFDLQIRNQLGDVLLVEPTFPRPPAGVHGLLLFPIEAVAVESAGGVTVGAEDESSIVHAPWLGTVTPSTDWDGAPHPFFSPGGGQCGLTARNCFRYEIYPAPLAPGELSPVRQVGFDVDSAVQRFHVRVLLAADLRHASALSRGPAR
jgi:hypothetical protein